ncbi:MAG: FtsB family cell division protein [Desulforhopalus sp.]
MSYKTRRTRSRPKQTLSPVQERRLLRILVFLLLLAILWISFAPGSGLFTYLAKRSELKELRQQTARIERQNVHLQEEIDRLHNDKEYLEKIARKEYGLLRKNEQVFDFSRQEPEKESE